MLSILINAILTEKFSLLQLERSGSPYLTIVDSFTAVVWYYTIEITGLIDTVIHILHYFLVGCDLRIEKILKILDFNVGQVWVPNIKY